MDTKEILLEYFKEMRKEINLRIENHSKLVATKVAVCGALLGFLLSKLNSDPNLKLVGLFFVPIISMLYDIMIAKNIRCIHRIGTFIRDQIEKELLTNIDLWEKYSGQKDAKTRNYGIVDIVFLNLFTLGTIFCPAIMLWRANDKTIAYFVGVILLLIFLYVIYFLCKCILFFVSSEESSPKT